MRVSVCVPTYNGSAFLADTLASISAQTFEDYEVVIVDDGSTDDTMAIVEEFAARDRRARIVRNTTRTGSSARNANRCADYARGDWMKFLFQDDLMTPACLERMLEAGARGRLVIAWHDYLFSGDVDPAVRAFYETVPSLATELPGDFAAPYEFCRAVVRRWRTNFIGPTSSSFIRRDCFEQYGRFSPDIVSFPDLEFWMRVGCREGLAIVPAPLVTFRVHDRSISARLRNDRTHAYRTYLDALDIILRLARSAEYAQLRETALRLEPRFDPEVEARRAAVEARWLAVDIRYRQRDDRALDQWKAFCVRHPAVRDVLHDADAERSTWSRVKQFVKAHL